VAADPVAIAELIDADQVRNGGMEGRGVLFEAGVEGSTFHCH
jgi:hypothetical protein